MPELGLPFFPMRRNPVPEMYEHFEMRDFMQQSNQKTIGIEVYVDADTMIVVLARWVAVIAQYRFAFVGKRKVYGMTLKVRCNERKGSLR